MENLKQVEPTGEQAKPTSEKKQVEPTPPKAKDATLGKTYTEEEFQKAQSGWGRQVTLAKAEVKQVKAEALEAKLLKDQAEAELVAIQREHEDMLTDDPEKRQAYSDRRAIARAKADLARKEAELQRKDYEAEQKIQSAALAVKAVEVSRETGIPISELENCSTEAGMENAGLKFQLAKIEEKGTETPPPVIDSAVSSATGGAEWSMEKIREMSKTPKGLAEFTKNLDAILKASREGKIK